MELKVGYRSNVSLEPRQIRIVVLAMFAGLVIYTTIAYVLSQRGPAPAADQAPIFAAVLAALALVLVVAATVVGRVQATVLERLGTAAPANAASNAELVGRLVKAALAEAFGLVGTTFMLVSGERLFLAAPLIAVFSLLRLLPRRGSTTSAAADLGPGDSSHSRPIDP